MGSIKTRRARLELDPCLARASVSASCGDLIGLNQLTNADGISFAMASAGDRIGSSSRINSDLRPQDTGRYLDRSDLGNGDALFGAAEKARLYPTHV